MFLLFYQGFNGDIYRNPCGLNNNDNDTNNEYPIHWFKDDAVC